MDPRQRVMYARASFNHARARTILSGSVSPAAEFIWVCCCTINWMAVLWPAEDTLSAPLARVSFNGLTNPEAYPYAPLGWLPGSGPLAVLLWFVGFSMLFGFAALKPLGVQI